MKNIESALRNWGYTEIGNGNFVRKPKQSKKIAPNGAPMSNYKETETLKLTPNGVSLLSAALIDFEHHSAEPWDMELLLRLRSQLGLLKHST
jgi:hypothetical protein